MVSLANIGNWTAETCSTEGSGNLILTGPLFANASFNAAVPAGKVWYSIIDGENREAGEGDFNGGNVIIRSSVRATLFNGIYNDVSPSAMVLSGEAFVACTFNADSWREFVAHINDIANPHEVRAIQVPYDPTSDPVTSEITVQDAMLDHAGSIEQRVASLSGIIVGGELTEVNPTQFSIADGNGEVFDSYTDPGNTSVIDVAWSGLSNITLLTEGGTAGRTFILVTGAGNVLQIVGLITPDIFRDNIILGAVYYVNDVITEVKNFPSVVKQTSTDLYDQLVEVVSLTGSEIRPVDSALSIWIEEGTLFFPGSNWENDRKNPNHHTVVQEGDSVTPITFLPMTQDSEILAGLTVIPEDSNPTGNTLDPLTGQQATIHRLYSIGTGAAIGSRQFILLYGQNQYANAVEAKQNLLIDDSITFFPSEIARFTFLGWICTENGTSDFDDINDAWIVNRLTNTASGSAGIQNDHAVLINRTELDQHPIESIGVFGGEQLRATLDAKPFKAGYPTIDGLHAEYAADLDDILVNSKYFIDSTAVTNEPIDFVGLGVIETDMWDQDTDQAVQILTSMDNENEGAAFIRNREAGVWSEWIPFGAGGEFWEFPVASFTAEAGVNYMFNENSGVLNIDMPLDPDPGDAVVLVDRGNTWKGTITVDGNGKTLESDAIIVLDVRGARYTFVFEAEGDRWRSTGDVLGTYRSDVPPQVGMQQAIPRWFDTNTGRTYIRFQDDNGDGSQVWVEENPQLAQGQIELSTGLVAAFAVAPLTDDWILCDGQAINRSKYVNLFNRIGETYGDGDTTTTFNVPDYRGQFLRGQDEGAGVDPDAAGRTDRGDGVTGDNIGTKQADAFQSHTHTHNLANFTASGNTTRSRPNTGAGSLVTGSAGNSSETRPANVYVQYYIYAGGATVVAADPLVGSVIQLANVQDGEVATGTTVLPADDTIPQITEGTEFMTLAFTPKFANSLLRVDVICNVAHSTTSTGMSAALFRDAVVNALASVYSAKSSNAQTPSNPMFTHFFVPGSIDSITFRVRAGGAGAGTMTFNGVNGSRIHGGVMSSSITITEIKQ